MISAGVWFAQPNIAVYRGLSGIDSALFTSIAATMWRNARVRGESKMAIAAVLTLITFIAKIGLELVTGATLFVDSGSAEFIRLPLVHLVGGLVGIAAAWRP